MPDDNTRVLSFHSTRAIGLDKPRVRAKGINHPKYSVKPEYACLTRESATAERKS